MYFPHEIGLCILLKTVDFFSLDFLYNPIYEKSLMRMIPLFRVSN